MLEAPQRCLPGSAQPQPSGLCSRVWSLQECLKPNYTPNFSRKRRVCASVGSPSRGARSLHVLQGPGTRGLSGAGSGVSGPWDQNHDHTEAERGKATLPSNLCSSVKESGKCAGTSWEVFWILSGKRKRHCAPVHVETYAEVVVPGARFCTHRSLPPGPGLSQRE